MSRLMFKCKTPLGMTFDKIIMYRYIFFTNPICSQRINSQLYVILSSLKKNIIRHIFKLTCRIMSFIECLITVNSCSSQPLLNTRLFSNSKNVSKELI